jgi:predicted  nucleic acid-binding Zn-ribbon protein
VPSCATAFLAIADRIAGKKSNAREIQEMKERINSLEDELRHMRVQVISIESNQEFSTKLLEDLKEKSGKAKAEQQ